MKRIVLKQLAREILAGNQYMTLATVNPDGRAWVAPVVYANDRTGNFYYLSQPESQHSRNIEADPRVSLTIFDSRQKWGEGLGLQIEGQARMLPVVKSGGATAAYFGREWPYKGSHLAEKAFKKMIKGKIYRFYQVIPSRVWMNDPRQEKDARVRVRM